MPKQVGNKKLQKFIVIGYFWLIHQKLHHLTFVLVSHKFCAPRLLRPG